MPTDLCRYCGSTYDLLHGHSCMPTTTTTNTGGDACAPQPSGLADGHRVTGPAEEPAPTPASPPATGQAILAEVERLRAEVERLQPQVENWHVYLRWRGKQDEAERAALDQTAPQEPTDG